MARKVFQYPAPLNLCHTDFLSLSLSLFLYLSLLLPPTHMHTHTNTLARTSHLLTLSSEILRQFFKPCALIYDPSKIKLLFYGTPELFFSLRTKKNWQTRKKRKHLKSKWRPRSDVRTLRRNSAPNFFADKFATHDCIWFEKWFCCCLFQHQNIT